MYRANWNDAKREVSRLNRLFFHVPNNKIKIKIRSLHKENWWGCVTETDDKQFLIITLHTHHDNYTIFRNVIAHEMVHVWQYHNGYYHDGNMHDKSFFSWLTATANYGYDIK